MDARIERLKARSSGLGPVLSVDEIERFEHRHGVTLPEGFRDFLLYVGNGGPRPPEYGLVPLGRMPGDHHADPEEQLSTLKLPFPLEEVWVWESDEDLTEAQEELLSRVSHGSLVLGTDGCGIYWHLIVTGPERGMVWQITGEGAQPCDPPLDFLDWYQYALDGGTDFWSR